MTRSAPTSSALNTSSADSGLEGLRAASNANAYAQHWLRLLVARLPAIQSGIVLGEDDAGVMVPAAMWPQAIGDVSELTGPAQRCADQCVDVIESLDPSDRGPARHALASPVVLESRVVGVVVVCTSRILAEEARRMNGELAWSLGWLESLFRIRLYRQIEATLARAGQALDLIALIADHESVDAACTAVATELARRDGCERVVIGLRRGARVRLTAISHTAWFERRSALAVKLEEAMCEAIEQRALLVWPGPEGQDEALIVTAQRQLAGEQAVVTVPVIAGTRAVGAITWQLPADRLDARTLQEFQSLAIVIAPMLARLDDQSRWISGRAVAASARAKAALTDPRRPSFAFGTAVALGLFAWVCLTDTEYRVPAKANLEGKFQRAIPAPFDGYIAEAPARAGQTVSRGTLLARLDDRELRLQRVQLEAELTQQERKRDDAVAHQDKATVSVATAQVAEVGARLNQVSDRLLRTRIEAPFDGVLLSGDLTQNIGSPVEQGKLLFELAPLTGYRVVLKVDERDVRRVRVGQRGVLVLSGMSDEQFGFTVRHVSVASAEEGRNVFRVEAELDKSDSRLRPGMEGVGKVLAGEETRLWIWTHRLVEWIRLAWWRYLP